MVEWWNRGLEMLCHLCSWRFTGPSWVKHGATWSDPEAEAAWAESWAGDLPRSPPNYPMVLWVRLRAICYRLFSKLKTACMTVRVTHIQLKPMWVKRFGRIMFLHRQVIEELQRSLYLLLVSGMFLWDIYGRHGQHRVGIAKSLLWASTAISIVHHAGGVAFDFLINFPFCSLRRWLSFSCLGQKPATPEAKWPPLVSVEDWPIWRHVEWWGGIELQVFLGDKISRRFLRGVVTVVFPIFWCQ